MGWERKRGKLFELNRLLRDKPGTSFIPAATDDDYAATVTAPVGVRYVLTVDADGCVWLAVWGAGAVHRYTPAGRLDGVLQVPARQVTSCTFGGPGLRHLFVTSARQGLPERELAEQPLAGAVFAARPAVGGFAADGFAG